MIDNQGEHWTICQRVQTVRMQLFGEYGGPLLAELLGIPQHRLARMELGGPIPAEIILKLIDVTGVSPRWLLSGYGETYGMPATRSTGGQDLGARRG